MRARSRRLASVLTTALIILATTLACAPTEPTSTAAAPAATEESAPIAIDVDPESAATADLQAVVTATPEQTAPAGQLLHPGATAFDQISVYKGPRTGDLDMMLELRGIRALVVPSKTYYFLDGPRQRGITYEGLKMFDEWLNEELGTGSLKVHVVIIPTSRDAILGQLAAGYGDIAAAGLTVTDERQQLVDFSDPFMSGVREILVTGTTAPELASLEDLAGQEIQVRRASSYYESLLALNRTLEAKGKPPLTLHDAPEYLEDEDLLEMVDTGILPFVVVDEHKAEFWDQIYENITPRDDLVLRSGGQIAWAYRKESPQLADLVNRFVAGHKRGTLMGNIVFNRYLKDTSKILNVLSSTDRRRYDDTVHFFQEYSSQYDFDYLMMVAQGYQESRLDQSLRSHRGAIGVMQLLPSTAADKSVGIPDIETIDRNVHAGIRYMRWIRDTYFADDDVDKINRTLFAFASYNAGPNRIARLRAETEKRGLDPDVWFRSVELVVAQKVGRETVEYVSNIYKYYTAYKLMQLNEERRAANLGDAAER